MDGTPEQLWSTSRAGATSARGYHYQDVVGAWLCARVLAGHLAISQIVPESLEDLSVEGVDACHVQVKSRQERKGDFTAGQTARFLLELFGHHDKRVQAGQSGRPVLVIERPVAGEVFDQWGRVLADLPVDHELRIALESVARERKHSQCDIDRMLAELSVFVLPWHAAALEIRNAVTGRHDLLPSAAEVGVRALRDAVAECVDRNAATGWSDRAGLDRTAIERITSETASLVDREGLEEALRTGAVEVVDFDRPLVTTAFYEGVDVQPGHIAAGLPAPRPEVTGKVVDAVSRGESVLVTGPSGAGKSTVMWAAAYVTRHVLWYRVRRLLDVDVDSIVRLAQATRPTLRTPVGFVVDGVGLGASAVWDALQQQLAAYPGVVLLGSARTEDTLLLRSLHTSFTVAVSLDEAVAAQIHKGLISAGVEVAPHWRDAYENSGGLTLEFTHLLTRGRRLTEVVAEQVRRRVVENRDLELKIIALVAVAHRWGATLSMRAVQDEVGAGDADFRLALARLNDEHLLHTRGSMVSGLHQLRSRALAEAVHAMPPPLLAETVISLLSLVDDHQLQPFVANALIEHPDLDSVVVDHLAVEVTSRERVAPFVALLRALRLVDFHRQAHEWAAIFERHGVAPSRRVVTLQLAMLGSSPPSFARPEAASVIAELSPDAGWDNSPLRDVLLGTLAPRVVARIVTERGDADEALQCFSAMVGTGVDITEDLLTALPSSRLSGLAATLTGDAIGEVLSTARLVSPELAQRMSESLFGGTAVLDRLRDEWIWLTEASVVEQDGVPTAFARLLHTSDSAQPDFETETRNFARTLLRCLPECERVDVQTLLPGGLPIQAGDLNLAAFRFGRANDHPPAAVEWNRMRSQVAASAMGAMDPTVRAHEAWTLVHDVTLYLRELANVWCAARGRTEDKRSLVAKQRSLVRRADALTLPLKRTEVFKSQSGSALASGGDGLHSLIDGIADNFTMRLATLEQVSSLAAYVGDTLRKFVREVREAEQWSLVGQEPPDDLEQLDDLLVDLHAVLAELAWGKLTQPLLLQTARGGDEQHALGRVADLARSMASNREERQREDFANAARAAGFRVDVVVRSPEQPDAVHWPPIEMAVLIELDEVAQWDQVLSTIATLLRHDPATEGWRPPILIVPTYQERLLPRLAHRLIANKAYPSPGSVWDDGLPAVHPTPLTDAMIEAHQALQGLSGLAVLALNRELDERHGALVHREVDRYQQAMRTASAIRPVDPVTEEMISFLASTGLRVQDEVNDGLKNGAEEDALAVGVARGVAGTPTEDLNAMVTMVFICLQWDLNPEAAARMLESRSAN